MNWGRLANKGGGSADYTQPEPEKDILNIQNAKDAIGNQPFEAVMGKEYVLSVRQQYKILPSRYAVIGGQRKVYVDHVQALWPGHFSVTPANGQGPIIESVLYNLADYVNSVYICNECGYGSCGKGQHTTWSSPSYINVDGKYGTPSHWVRF